MLVEYKSDFPVTEAACKKATGKGLKEWFAALDDRCDQYRYLVGYHDLG